MQYFIVFKAFNNNNNAIFIAP